MAFPVTPLFPEAESDQTKTFRVSKDNATDRDSATPTRLAGAFLQRVWNEVYQLTHEIIAAGCGRIDDNGALDVTWSTFRAGFGTTIASVATSTLTLTDDATNYVEVNSSGTVSKNTTAFTSGLIPLATVVTAAGDISTITDKRAWLTLGYTDEQAQDAIGTILADSTTINFTYTDATPEITAVAIYQMSITADASGLKLSGDAASPGNSKVYGTNGAGTKGWYANTAGGDMLTTTYDPTVTGYVNFARGLRTSTPTNLSMAVVADGKYLRRSGATIIGDTPSGAGDMTKAVYDVADNGMIDAAAGGTDVDSSAATGVAIVTAGAWTFPAQLTVEYGGTGRAVATAYCVVCGGTTDTGVLQSVAGLGDLGQVFTSQGPAALPTWSAAGSGDMLKATYDPDLDGVVAAADTATTATTAADATASSQNQFNVGDGAASNKYLLFLDTATNPWIGWDVGTQKLQVCENGVNGYNIINSNEVATSAGADLIPRADGAGLLDAGWLPDATDAVPGKVELATAAETTTGTDATRAVTPDGLRGSDYGKDKMCVKVIADATDLTVVDDIFHFTVCDEWEQWNLVGIVVVVATASTNGLPTFMLYNASTTTNMLTTAVTIDENEVDSRDAAIPAVIDVNNDNVAAKQKIQLNCTTAGTGTKGCELWLIFQRPGA